MGSGASTTSTKVDRIRIDTNGDIWKKKSNGSEKLCRPGTGSRPLSGLAKRIRDRSNSLHSKNSKENNSASSAENLHSKLENLEHSNIDLETTVHQLKHEMRLLELEKAELMEEVAFYKNQVNQNHTQATSIGYFKDKNEEKNNETIQTKTQLERDLYENLVHKLQNELKNQQDKYQRRLEFERELREKMEDVVRIHLGDAFLFDAKNSLAHDTLPVVKAFDSAKPLCRNLLSSHGRLSTPGNASTNFVQTIEEEETHEGTPRATSQAEIFRVHDEASDDQHENSHTMRPSTADVNSTANMNFVKIGRGESAPILFQRSKSREKRNKLRKRRVQADKESIDSLDEEIEDILSGSFSSLSNSISSNKRQNIPSAKSRDSGYLGESAHFEDNSKLDTLNLP